jgi:hypothetical protein
MQLAYVLVSLSTLLIKLLSHHFAPKSAHNRLMARPNYQGLDQKH